LRNASRARNSPGNPGQTKRLTLKNVIDSVAPEQRERTPAFVCLTGLGMGRVYRLDGDHIEIGREVEGLRLDDECVSRRHAVVDRVDGYLELRDLGSTNGTICNGQKLMGPVMLREGDRIRLGRGVVLRFEMHDEVEAQMKEQLYELATRDPLTGALNRRAFFERFEVEWDWHRRHDEPCALLMIDVDRFKQVNDTHGHSAGDQVLTKLGELVRDSIRATDTFARLGGEEFLLLVRATGAPRAIVIAERIREMVEHAAVVVNDVEIHVTVSIGVATSADPAATSPGALLNRADSFVYAAKEAGRNKVVSDDCGQVERYPSAYPTAPPRS
jgi:two-component system cell cycle response regulator